jgi:hypothetical protein
VDQKPRKLSVEDYRVLISCSEMVVRRLEEKKFDLLHTAASDRLLRTLNAFRQAVGLCDMGARGWPILFANDAWISQLGTLPLWAPSCDIALFLVAPPGGGKCAWLADRVRQ